MAPTTAAQGATVTPALRRCVATAAGAAFSGVAVQRDRLAGDGGVGEADRTRRDAAIAPEVEETGNVVEGREGTVKPDLVRVPQRALDDPQVHPVHGLVGSFPDPRTVPVPQLSSAQVEQGQEVGVVLGGAGEVGALIPAGLEVLAAAVSKIVGELAAASAVCSLQRAGIAALQSIVEIRLVISRRKKRARRGMSAISGRAGHQARDGGHHSQGAATAVVHAILVNGLRLHERRLVLAAQLRVHGSLLEVDGAMVDDLREGAKDGSVSEAQARDNRATCGQGTHV